MMLMFLVDNNNHKTMMVTSTVEQIRMLITWTPQVLYCMHQHRKKKKGWDLN